MSCSIFCSRYQEPGQCARRRTPYSGNTEGHPDRDTQRGLGPTYDDPYPLALYFPDNKTVVFFVCLNVYGSHRRRPSAWVRHQPPPYRPSPWQAVAFPHALPQGVLAAAQDLFSLLLACLGFEVVFVVGQCL